MASGSPGAAGMTRKTVEALSARMREPDWALTRRLAAWDAFEQLPMPQVTHPEKWRRTDLGDLDPGAFCLVGGTGDTAQMRFIGTIAREVGERAGLITHLDGSLAAIELMAEAAQQGVLFSDLATAVREHPDLVRDYLMTTVAPPDEHRLRALHSALWTGGTFLYVPKGAEVVLPLMSQTWLGAPGCALFPHTLLIAEEGSSVTLIELFASTGDGPRTLSSGAVELILRAGARVQYAAVQEWGLPMWEVGSLIRAHLARDASLRSLVVALGGGLVKVDVESQLLGPGASSEMLGVYFGTGGQQVNLHTLQEHQAPSTSSDLLYRGAVKDTARAVFSGLIRVDPGAQKTNAFQVNRNLILSRGARSDSIPMLEIMADDLRCTHGSATSHLDDEQIFYLMSRGISRKRAAFMIVEGFFADVFDRIPRERVRSYLRARVAEKMI
ncbi:MAG: Fe-S cluster assembly protein SufD [bacterium]|nr:Fe-S cluster assembly protein SufD [bacterium]